MDKWKNILDENILKYNVSFAAIFVLNYECLKDYIINQVRDFILIIESGMVITIYLKKQQNIRKK